MNTSLKNMRLLLSLIVAALLHAETPAQSTTAIPAGSETQMIARARTYLANKKARLGENPAPFSLGNVPGFGDFHIHQFTQAAYDGRLYHGDYEGPLQIALRHCNDVIHGLSYGILGVLGQIATLWGKESPYFDWMPHSGNTHGISGNAAQDMRDWPTWRTYGHVQYWEGWLREAKNQGLSMVVMSATNSRFLCGALPPWNTHAKRDFRSSDPLTGLQFEGPGACDDMKNSLRQILISLDYAARNSDWYEIALTPGEARRIAQQGKLAVILALESSHIFRNAATPAAVEAQLQLVYDAGIRSIQPVHHTDNQFSGAAQFNGFLSFMNNYWVHKNEIFDKLKQSAAYNDGHSWSEVNNIANEWTQASQTRRLDDQGFNVMGLTPLGRELIRMMIERRMLIDAAHMSEKAMAETFSIMQNNQYYPYMVSHARLRRLYPECPQKNDNTPKCSSLTANEMALSDQQIKNIKQTGGVIGLRTGPEPKFTYRRSGIANNCHGSTRSWAQEYSLAVIGYGITPGFATDMQGGAEQLRPRFYDRNSTWSNSINNWSYDTWACGSMAPNWGILSPLYELGEEAGLAPAVSDDQALQGNRSINGTGTNFDLIGFGHIGHINDVIRDIEKMGLPMSSIRGSSQAFIAMWDRAYAANRTALNNQITVTDADIDYESLNRNFCPLPTKKISGIRIEGKVACLSFPDPTIQRHNCIEQGSRISGTYCLVSEKETHVRVRTIVEDICPGIRDKVGAPYNGSILCKDIPSFPISKSNCGNNPQFSGYCLMEHRDNYWYRVRALK